MLIAVILTATAVSLSVNLLTYLLNKKRISNLEKAHETSLNLEFHVAYDQGWKDGSEYGQRHESLMRMIKDAQK